MTDDINQGGKNVSTYIDDVTGMESNVPIETMDAAEFQLRTICEERGLRVLKHPRGSRKVEYFKVKDADGVTLVSACPAIAGIEWLQHLDQTGRLPLPKEAA